MNTKTEPSMLEGGEITAEETLAIQLWYTYVTENGDIANTLDWLRGGNPIYIAAQKWMRMEPYQREIWLAVAATAARVIGGGH